MAEFAAASARLLFDRLTPRAPIDPAVVVADLGTIGDQPYVSVGFAGATRRAVWAIPNAIEVGKTVFVEAEDAGTDAPLFVVAPNYQVAWAYSGGLGTGPLGVAPLGE